MKFTEAKQQFDIRYYRWASTEFKREIEQSFPSFRSFKDGTVRQTRQFMEQLDRHQQLALAYYRLATAHPADAIKAVGDNLPPDGASLNERLTEFSINDISGLRTQLLDRSLAGENVKFPKKRKLRSLVATHFTVAFGHERVKSKPDALHFRSKVCGWNIDTHFDFGRFEPGISYDHAIWGKGVGVPYETAARIAGSGKAS